MRDVKFEARVDVTHLPGVLDPQGATVERALPALGYTNVSDVRIGKSIHLVVDAPDAGAARDQVDEMCHRLLANPVIEAFTFELTALEPAS
ncbi:MAG: phosphoribosylformylglycinamidine synthase subunit PurS [Acidimicrobiia bacterium]